MNLEQNYSFGNDFPTPLFSAWYKSSVLKEGDFLKWSCLVNIFQLCQSYLILSLIFKLSVSPAPSSKNLSKICQIHNINPRPRYFLLFVKVGRWSFWDKCVKQMWSLFRGTGGVGEQLARNRSQWVNFCFVAKTYNIFFCLLSNGSNNFFMWYRYQ